MSETTTPMMGEKKGHLRVTIDVEVNEALMDSMKENIANISQHLPMMGKRKEKMGEEQ